MQIHMQIHRKMTPPGFRTNMCHFTWHLHPDRKCVNYMSHYMTNMCQFTWHLNAEAVKDITFQINFNCLDTRCISTCFSHIGKYILPDPKQTVIHGHSWLDEISSKYIKFQMSHKAKNLSHIVLQKYKVNQSRQPRVFNGLHVYIRYRKGIAIP